MGRHTNEQVLFIYLFIYFLLDDGIDFSHLGYKHQETSQSVLFFDDKYSF